MRHLISVADLGRGDVERILDAAPGFVTSAMVTKSVRQFFGVLTQFLLPLPRPFGSSRMQQTQSSKALSHTIN